MYLVSIYTHRLRTVAAIAFSFIIVMSVLAPPSAAEDQIINYRDADIRAVVDDIARITGRTFILDPRVANKVTIISRTPIPTEQVFELFLSTLRVYGFTAVPIINGAYKIVPEDQGVLDRTARPEDASGDQLITEIFRLYKLDPIIALNTIKPLSHRLGRVIAQQNQNYLIVVDYASNLQRIREVLEELDKDTSVTRIVALENTAGLDIVETIGLLRSQGQRPDAFGANLSIVAVPGSDLLVIKGDARIIDETIALIRSIDERNVNKGSIKVIYLQHANAEQMVPMLEQVSQSLASGVASSGDGGGPDGQRASQGGNARASIAFHPGTNALVISATPDMQKTLERVIKQLDIPRQRIVIEAIIVEVSDTAAHELGLQYVFQGDGNTIPFTATNFSNTATSVLASTGAIFSGGTSSNAGTRGDAFNSLFSGTGTVGGVLTQASNGNIFGIILNALDTDTDSNVLSTPSISTLDNEPARLIVGQEIPITTGESLGSNNTTPFRSIERKEVGIKLEVRPQINAGNQIRLYIKQEVSSIQGVVTNSSTDLITNKREIETTVMANDGEIIVLGGLIQTDEQITINKVPILGDIPLLGRLFRSEVKTKVKTNLMVFLRAVIIKDAAHSAKITARKYNLLRDAQLALSGNEQSALDNLLRDVIGAEVPARSSNDDK